MEVDTWRSLLLYKLVLSRVVFLISLETAVCKEIESRSPGRKQEIHPEGSRNLDLLLSSYFTGQLLTTWSLLPSICLISKDSLEAVKTMSLVCNRWLVSPRSREETARTYQRLQTINDRFLPKRTAIFFHNVINTSSCLL